MKQTEFLKYINIGKIIHAEMKKRNLIKDIETIAEKANLTKWFIKNTFRQYILNNDFIRNIYLPYYKIFL